MLQWMGGSRRKVTATRKSTQKRQKQYFEQRKRQQQHHIAGLESYTDGVSLLGQDNKEQRSLDVLSLLNLSSIAQECKTRSNVGENSEVNTSTVNYQVKKGPPTILTNGETPADYVEFNERASSGYQVEIVPPKSDADRHNNAFNGKGDKPDNWKTATEHQLSVFDLLGDDGPYGNLEGSPVCEAHVAFSVEGLGKVGTETPVHSPHQPHRVSSYDCSLLKDARQLRSSKNLNFVLDDLEVEVGSKMQDINMSPSGNSLELPFYPMGIEDPFSNPKQGVSTFRDFMHHGGHSSKIRRSFGDEETFYNIKDKNENIWNGSVGFPDYNSPDDWECDLSWKHWPGQMDGTSADFVKTGNHELLDFTSEGHCISKKRNAMKARDRFNISDLSAPYLRHQTSENDHDFATSDGTRSPMLGRIWGFTGVNNQPDWPSFATEDSRDSLSLLSEESCTSSAVRGEATYNQPSNSMVRKSLRRHDKGFCSRVNKYSSKNMHTKEAWYKNGDDIGSRPNNANGSGEFTKKSHPSSSKPAHHSNSAFLGKEGPHESWLFGDGYTSVDINPDFSSLYRTSETKKAPPGPKFWTDKLSGAFPVPELQIGAKTLYEQSIRGFPVEYSPSSSSFYEKPAFYKPSNHTHTYGSSIFNDIGARPDEPDFSLKMESKPPDSFHIAGSLGDIEFPDISVQESVSKYEEHASSIQPTDCQKFGLEKEISNGNNGLSSEARKPMDASDSKDNCSGCQETEDETPEIVAKNSPKNAEEASSEVKITERLEGSEEGKGCHDDTQLPLAFLNRNRVNQETEVQGSEERLVMRREQNKCLETVDPSCQVMMLESYVLQLLCVQKVLKEASAQDPEKKV
ncbi:hypothetical protein VitviT2T_008478 [Vitis vinifera]|uniref:Uncharacterized protein n=1 Tax=Vitis vinifera TaxID=29760 RepID=A0ABY9C1Y9_VITVI|nr:uncharacterized protein LOC100853672 isoform X4 [Vitis vinifera]XP_019076076.1 uncharacterized protein LOC100853672 isoform X4 [Vitis vinifera]WJZ89250.1 hypothetical protein VitviT2T_008478 [Vitis vinifera]|eukprot:XP_010650812.1 PREDICTED: uncharacterized protein LOC100853672 isoform X4 [Vitis vinifera]